MRVKETYLWKDTIIERKCNQCGVDYQAKRSNSKFCSDSCRCKWYYHSSYKGSKSGNNMASKKFDEITQEDMEKLKLARPDLFTVEELRINFKKRF
jgi:hypothetical protein